MRKAVGSEFAPAIGIALVTIVASVTAVYWPPRTGEMAVVFAPGTDQKHTFNAILSAGGRFVSQSKYGNIAIAYALDEGFPDRIRQFGGLFTLAATGLCAASNTQVSSS